LAFAILCVKNPFDVTSSNFRDKSLSALLNFAVLDAITLDTGRGIGGFISSKFSIKMKNLIYFQLKTQNVLPFFLSDSSNVLPTFAIRICSFPDNKICEL
jgi:hypothetical protein